MLKLLEDLFHVLDLLLLFAFLHIVQVGFMSNSSDGLITLNIIISMIWNLLVLSGFQVFTFVIIRNMESMTRTFVFAWHYSSCCSMINICLSDFKIYPLVGEPLYYPRLVKYIFLVILNYAFEVDQSAGAWWSSC